MELTFISQPKLEAQVLRTTHGTANGQRQHHQRRPLARKGWGCASGLFCSTLGRAFNSSGLLASGSGTKQSTLGNLSFSAVIRVDIVQQRHIKELETQPTPQVTASRFENVLIQPKFGKDAYGTGVGR